MNRSFNTKSSNRNIHEDYASDAECYANGYLSDAGMYIFYACSEDGLSLRT